MKRVLITGNQGFIGTWLSLYIKKVYPDVKIFGIDDRRSLGERMIDFFPSNMLGSSSSLMNDIKLENYDKVQITKDNKELLDYFNNNSSKVFPAHSLTESIFSAS